MPALLLASWFGQLPMLAWLLWGSLLVSMLTLLVLMRTNWGRERPTHRYAMLSIVAHLLLICVATTIRFAAAPAGDGPAPVQVRIVMQAPTAADAPAETPKQAIETPNPSVPEASKQESALPAQVPPAPEPPPTEPVLAEQANSEQPPAPKQVAEPSPLRAPPLVVPETPPQPVSEAPLPSTPVERLVPLAPVADPSQEVTPPNTMVAATRTPDVTPAFVSRAGDERLRRLLEEGGDSRTENAVAAALAWIAAAQSPDGRWDADRWAAGRERDLVLGHDRTGVGLKADTAMTGLSLLAIMGAGHSHTEGPFADTLRDGLAYLVRTQRPDGALFGEASLFAQTYCHSMAAFALAEALAITEDERLEHATRRAIEFLVRRQDPTTGGWRYRAGDPGDMSQLGWILMALRSSEIAGVSIPPATWEGIERFVRATSRGQHGGLASYRTNSPPSHSMTAESFYCRQILGSPLAGPTSEEAIGAILQQPPGSSSVNLYAWYYATLALHHHRRTSANADHAWREWNESLKQTLLSTQVTEGLNKGSWSPNTVWGRCGGRVYSTALATMCLEVYYRYDPSGLARDPWIAAREPAGTFRR